MVAWAQCLPLTVTFTALQIDPDLISGPFLCGFCKIFLHHCVCPQRAEVRLYRPSASVQINISALQ